MDRSLFSTNSPGRLVETTGYEVQARGGVPESVPIRTLAFVPDPLPPKLSDHDIAGLLGDVSWAQTSMIRLEGLLRGIPNPDLLLGPIQRREARYSAKIENTTASVRELVIAEANVPPDRPEVLEVRNNLRSLHHGIRSDLPLSLRLIREMHEVLLAGVDDRKQPGAFRNGQVHIHGPRPGIQHARFVPPPHGETLVRCLGDFEKYLNRKLSERFVLPIELALMHYQFECIHPFLDGNGRVGRLLIPLVGLKSGLLDYALPNISRFLEHHRDEYCAHLLNVSARGEWAAWIRFFCRAIAEDCEADASRAKRLRSLHEKYVGNVTGKQKSSLSKRLVDLLFIRPAVTVAIVAKELHITAPPAQRHISRLEDAGILREITQGKWGRVWVAEELVRLIDAED